MFSSWDGPDCSLKLIECENLLHSIRITDPFSIFIDTRPFAVWFSTLDNKSNVRKEVTSILVNEVVIVTVRP